MDTAFSSSGSKERFALYLALDRICCPQTALGRPAAMPWDEQGTRSRMMLREAAGLPPPSCDLRQREAAAQLNEKRTEILGETAP